MLQQIVSFEELFGHIKPDGVYLCEDLHTSYFRDYGGGLKRRGSFIEYSKNFIDYLHAWHSRQNSLKVNSFTRTVHSLHYYDSILVIEKRPMVQPHSSKTGTQTIPYYAPEYKGFGLFMKNVRYRVRNMANKVLAAFRLPLKNGDFDY